MATAWSQPSEWHRRIGVDIQPLSHVACGLGCVSHGKVRYERRESTAPTPEIPAVLGRTTRRIRPSWLVLCVVIAVTYSPQTADDAEVFGQDRRDIVM